MGQDDAGPVFGNMTPLAIVPEPTAMDIVAAMTVAALRTQFGGVAGSCMTGRTNQVFVLSGQREIGLRIVVECPATPVGCIVAVGALGGRAQRSFVLGILVTVGATGTLDRECLVLVAGLAFGFRVFPQKWEVGQRMIKADVCLPIVGIMTSST